MEKYSVLISLYIKENPEFLDVAIGSMIKQSYTPDEIVIVKDGPISKELQGVLDRYVGEYPSIFTIVGYANNRGLGFALNYGLKYCRNELVARMDTDDISVLSRCEQQVQYFMNHPEVDIVSGDISEFIDSPSNIVGYRKLPCSNSDIVDYMKYRCALNHVAVMFRKSAVLAAGSYQDWFWNEDYYLWIRMVLNGCVFANTGSVLVNVRTGKDVYARRGGMKYFRSEIDLQKYMLRNKIIGYPTFVSNWMKRFIVQVLLPNKVRGFVFRTFARDK